MYTLEISKCAQVIGRPAIDADTISGGTFGADSIGVDRIVSSIITDTS